MMNQIGLCIPPNDGEVSAASTQLGVIDPSALDARTWSKDVMREYGFRDDAQSLLLDKCNFFIEDPFSTRGGGWCRFGYGGDRTTVYLYTGQPEAAVHEMAHAWWFLIEVNNAERKNLLISRLIAYLLHQSEQPLDSFATVRNLCRVYRYGNEIWSGMWMSQYNRWNHDEIFAGLASGTMGNLTMYPYDLRRIYTQMFEGPRTVYLPQVTKA